MRREHRTRFDQGPRGQRRDKFVSCESEATIGCHFPCLPAATNTGYLVSQQHCAPVTLDRGYQGPGDSPNATSHFHHAAIGEVECCGSVECVNLVRRRLSRDEELRVNEPSECCIGWQAIDDGTEEIGEKPWGGACLQDPLTNCPEQLPK